MATRILGPTGSKRRKRFLLGPVLLVALAALFMVGSAQAVHDDGFFELGPTPTAPEANITNILGNATDPGPDWANLFTASGPSGTTVTKVDANSNGIPDCEEAPGKECAFIRDPSSAGGALDPTTFSGFGTSNKNNDPISGPNTLTGSDCQVRGLTSQQCNPWGWDAGNIPAKDDLTNVYAYQVVAPADSGTNIHKGDVIIYGGLERESPSGDSYVDLEFFQNSVALCNSGSPDFTPTPTCFTGVRKTGDIIVSMNFLRGGALGSIEIRKFNELTNSYGDPIGAASGQGCFSKTGASGDDICAFNNSASIDGGPWANYDNHGNVITSLPANAFTEMGVDITNVLGESPCLSTFMGKTRSSASFTSELKDFAGPTTFSRCAPSTALTKRATDGHGNTVTTVHSGDSVTYLYAEANDGKDPLSSVSVSDDKCSPVSSTLGDGSTTADSSHNIGDLNNDNILDPTETWSFSCTAVITATTTNIATATGTDTLTGKTVTWCDPTLPVPANTFCDQDEQASATVTVIAPATTLTKTAAVSVTYTFKEKNTGNNDLSGVSVTDAYNSSHNSGLGACTVTPVNQTGTAFNIGDINSDGLLNAGAGGNGETWTFACTVSSTDGSDVDVWNTGTGHGTDTLGTAVPSTNESDGVKVAVTHCAGPCS